MKAASDKSEVCHVEGFLRERDGRFFFFPFLIFNAQSFYMFVITFVDCTIIEDLRIL